MPTPEHDVTVAFHYCSECESYLYFYDGLEQSQTCFAHGTFTNHHVYHMFSISLLWRVRKLPEFCDGFEQSQTRFAHGAFTNHYVYHTLSISSWWRVRKLPYFAMVLNSHKHASIIARSRTIVFTMSLALHYCGECESYPILRWFWTVTNMLRSRHFHKPLCLPWV